MSIFCRLLTVCLESFNPGTITESTISLKLNSEAGESKSAIVTQSIASLRSLDFTVSKVFKLSSWQLSMGPARSRTIDFEPFGRRRRFATSWEPAVRIRRLESEKAIRRKFVAR